MIFTSAKRLSIQNQLYHGKGQWTARRWDDAIQRGFRVELKYHPEAPEDEKISWRLSESRKCLASGSSSTVFNAVLLLTKAIQQAGFVASC
jgi:hypothetical protein